MTRVKTFGEFLNESYHSLFEEKGKVFESADDAEIEKIASNEKFKTIEKQDNEKANELITKMSDQKHPKDSNIVEVDPATALGAARIILANTFNEIYGDGKDDVESNKIFLQRYIACRNAVIAAGKLNHPRAEMPVINNSNFGGSKTGKSDHESAPQDRGHLIRAVLGKVDKNVRDRLFSNQVFMFKFMLAHGFIDVDNIEAGTKMHDELMNDKDKATLFLLSGKLDDDDKDADKVSAVFADIKAKDMKPSQSDIFVGKSFGMATAGKDKGYKTLNGKEGMAWLLDQEKVAGQKMSSIDLPTKTTKNKAGEEVEEGANKYTMTIVSKDGYIIDGHHRWLGATLADPDATFPCVRIGKNLDEVIAIANAFTGAIGNKFNA